jgi:Transmembrane protein 43
MGDSFSETSYRGLGDNLIDSIKGVIAGIAMFLLSFPILWWNEGRTDMSTVAKTAVVVKADASDTAGDGKLVAVTAPLKNDGSLGDPDFLKPGPYAALDRRVEMFAWVEKVTKTEKKQLGGGTKVVTTYDYEKKWTDHPADSADFRYPEEHENPSMPFHSREWQADKAWVGAFAFVPADVHMLPSRPLSLDGDKLLPGHKHGGRRVDDTLFIGKGELDQPRLGDLRITWQSVAAGRTVTFYGKREGKSSIVPYLHKGEDKLFRVIDGTHEAAVAQMHDEHVAMTWFLRILGFIFMWMGMALVLGPFHAIFDIVPFVGSGSRFLAGLFLFPVALLLSGTTMVVSMIFHSTVALVIILIGFVVGAAFWIKSRKRSGRA